MLFRKDLTIQTQPLRPSLYPAQVATVQKNRNAIVAIAERWLKIALNVEVQVNYLLKANA
jgi:hypothetical protein